MALKKRWVLIKTLELSHPTPWVRGVKNNNLYLLYNYPQKRMTIQSGGGKSQRSASIAS